MIYFYDSVCLEFSSNGDNIYFGYIPSKIATELDSLCSSWI